MEVREKNYIFAHESRQNSVFPDIAALSGTPSTAKRKTHYI